MLLFTGWISAQEAVINYAKIKATFSKKPWLTSDFCSRTRQDWSLFNNVFDSSTQTIDASLPDSRHAIRFC